MNSQPLASQGQQWVARHHAPRARLALPRALPHQELLGNERSSRTSTVERFERRWSVRTVVTQGPYPDTRRVDISVGPEAEFGEQGRIVLEQATLIGKPYDRN